MVTHQKQLGLPSTKFILVVGDLNDIVKEKLNQLVGDIVQRMTVNNFIYDVIQWLRLT